MQWQDILFLCIFAALVLALVVLKVFKVGNRRRGVVKMVTTLSFLAAGVFGCVRQGGGVSIVVLVGLFFAALGDLFLVFMDSRPWFIAGIMSFGCASLTFSVFSIVQYHWYWWSVPVLAVLIAGNIISQKVGVLNYGKNIVYLNVYVTLVFACGCLGLSLFCQGIANLPMFLFGLGCFMYFASDVCLGMYMFKFHNVAVDAVNSVLYFPGMLLIALSLLV